MSESLKTVGIPSQTSGTRMTGSAGPTPNDLLVAVAKGDQRAFELFYGCVAGMILGTARSILRDRAQAEEVTQEVMVELWRTASRYSPDKGDAIAWAMTFAHRRAVDRVRSAQARTRRDSRATFEANSMRPFDEVAETVAAREEHRQIRTCLARLTGLQRESIMLAYYQGHTYSEIGEILHVPAATVKTRVRDALIRLRDYLKVG